MSKSYSYEQFDRIKRIKENTCDCFFTIHKSREGCVDSLKDSLDAYNNGNNSVDIFNYSQCTTDEVIDHFRQNGLHHVGISGGAIFLDNRSWFTKWWNS